MGGESFFKIFSLGILSLIFISAVASANKDQQKKGTPEDLSIIFSHINLAAQVNAFNKDPKQIPPENIEDTRNSEKPLPKATR